jgi:hypothetical protein
MTIRQNIFELLLLLPRRELIPPPISANHLFRNIRNRANELARCKATVNAKYGESGLVVNSRQEPPTQAGIKTACPKLEIGNNSVMP